MDSLLGTLVAMLLSSLMIAGFIPWSKMGVDSIKTAGTAGQMVVFNKAVQQYVADNGPVIAGSATPSSAVTITLAMLQGGGYLPAGFSGSNPFQQTWQAQVLQPS